MKGVQNTCINITGKNESFCIQTNCYFETLCLFVYPGFGPVKLYPVLEYFSGLGQISCASVLFNSNRRGGAENKEKGRVEPVAMPLRMVVLQFVKR